MVEQRDGTFVTFLERFRQSPVRWVVLVHALFLGTLVTLLTLFPNKGVLWLLDASLVTAQVALLLIWLTSDCRRPAGHARSLGATGVLLVIYVIHMPAVRDPAWIFGAVCMVPGIYLLLGVLALPLAIAESRGLRITRLGRNNVLAPVRLQFSMRTILVVAICVALLFSLKGFLTAVKEKPAPIAIGIPALAAVVAMVLVSVAIYLSIPLVAVWAVLTPGKILPRLVTAVVGWALGAMLVFHYTQIEEVSLEPVVQISIAAAGAIPILLATLFVLRQLRYRAVWADSNGWVFLDEPNPGSSLEGVSNDHEKKPPSICR